MNPLDELIAAAELVFDPEIKRLWRILDNHAAERFLRLQKAIGPAREALEEIRKADIELVRALLREWSGE